MDKHKLDIFILKFKFRTNQIKREVAALYLACKRPDMPLLPKVISILVVGYALSPIDLIPDFIPVIGLLDDFILIPIGIALAIKFIPRNIMIECRQESENAFKEGKPKNWIAGGVVILIWLVIFIYILKRFLK